MIPTSLEVFNSAQLFLTNQLIQGCQTVYFLKMCFFKRLQNTEMNGLEFKHYPLCNMGGKGNVHKWHFYLCNKQQLLKFCICEATLGKKTTTNHPINWFFKNSWARKMTKIRPSASIFSRMGSPNRLFFTYTDSWDFFPPSRTKIFIKT